MRTRISRLLVAGLWTLVAGLWTLSTRPLGAQPTGGASQTAKSASGNDSTVLARVNGQPITDADLQHFARILKLTNAELPQQRAQLLERLIDRQLLRGFLTQQKVAADPKLLEEHLTRLKTRLKDRGEDFNQVIAKAGFTEESLRQDLTLPLDWEAYVRRELTPQKLREIWNTRKHEFDGSEVRAAHIVLHSNDPDADEKKLAALRAQIVAKEIAFADAAKKYSQAPSAAQGGDLGRFGFRGKQPPPFPQVAFALKVGEVSEPFRSRFGVHLLTVTERTTGLLSLEDARPEILQVLSEELQRDVLQQERAKAKIERP